MKYNVGKYKNRDVYIDDCIDLVDHLTKNIQQILSVYSIENLKDDEEVVQIKDILSSVLEKYDVLIHQTLRGQINIHANILDLLVDQIPLMIF